MSIENLIKVLPPPAEPISAFSGPWEPIEAEIGTTLPQDYKDFTRLYGFGQFMEFLSVHSPVCRSPYVRLVPEIRAMRELFRDDESPYPMWPAPGGLLVCAKTDFGDYLYWLTRGPPEDWRIVVWGRSLHLFEAFDCDLTDFLAGVVTLGITPEAFPDGLDEAEDDELFAPTPDIWPERSLD